MKTYQPSAKDISRQWYVVDAEGESLGRLATRVATALRGKHKPTYTPHLDVGDYVVVINADKLAMEERRSAQKTYYHYSGYPGGLKSVPFLSMLEKKPTEIVERAVKGMLPSTRLGRQMASKLKVYAGAEHPHAAQQPQPLPDHI